MRFVTWTAMAVAAAVGLSGSAAWAHGGGGGGGGHGGGHGGVVVIVGGQAVPYAPKGAHATMALEMTDAPMTAAEGDMTKGQVIARQVLRTADAVVLEAPVQGRHRMIPAGTPLARVTYNGDQTVWCDIRPVHRFLFPYQYDCLHDDDGDGRFEHLWNGESLAGFVAYTLSGVAVSDPLPAPVAYRKAQPAERPTILVGYRFCDGDGVAGPPRFAMALAPPGETDSWPLVGGCRFGVWPDAGDKSHVDIDRLHLTVTAGPAGALHFKVQNQFPAQALAALWPDAPMRGADEARTPSPPPAPGSPRQTGPQALIATGPSNITTGAIVVGQVLLTAPVRHGMTGVLQNRINPGLNWRSDTALEVGQPMFGIPLNTGQTIWCGPHLGPDHVAYEAACLYPNGGNGVWFGHRTPAFMPTGIRSYAGATSASSAPSIAPGPITTPPLTLSLALSEVKPVSQSDPTLVYVVDVRIDWGQGPQTYRQLSYRLNASAAHIKILDDWLILKPGAKPGEMIVERGAS